MSRDIERDAAVTAGTRAAGRAGRSRLRAWAKWVCASLAVLAAALLLSGATYQFIATKIDGRRYPAPGRMVDVGGYSLRLNCTGAGTQTVVLESGLGGGALDWSLVQPEVAKFARVCSYDHAGAGWSEAGPEPRDSQQLVTELHTLLGNAGLRPPYVLVGHSLGGLNVQLYASRYPEEVVGVVLVDSTHEDQWSRKELTKPPAFLPLLMKAAAPFGVGRVLLNMNPPSENISPALAAEWAALYSHTGHLYSVADEIANIGVSMAQLRAEPMRLGGKPLIVLTRGKPEEAEVAERAWQELQSDFARRSSNGRQIIAANSGHYIQLDEPGLVVESVRQLVEAAGR